MHQRPSDGRSGNAQGLAARAWFTVNGVLAVVALAVQIPISAADTAGDFDTPGGRVANLFTLFTVLTNLLVAGTGLVLAINPEHRSTLLRVLRLDAVLGIVITAVIYHWLLAGIDDLRGAEVFVSLIWHTVSPLMAVLGWVLFGPRRLIDLRIVGLSVIYPLAWLAFTLVRGEIVDYYPYPFVDVAALGYLQVTLNCLGITALFFGLAALVLGADRLLARRSPATAR